MPARSFPTTQWSLVLSARGGARADAGKALATLCEAYWYPLYAFARTLGRNGDDALDLTQGFFAYLLERGVLDDIRPGVGRFRSFLLSALRNYASRERDRGRAAKRGGHATIFSLDAAEAEQRYRLEPHHDVTPERVFERSWGLTLIARARTRLRREMHEAGKGELYDRLEPALGGSSPRRPYGEIAAELGITEDVVKSTVLRLRRRLGRELRQEIAQTVASREEIDDELRYLIEVVRDG